MGWKKFAWEYLAFSRRDRVAVIALLALILGAYFLPQFIPKPDYSQTSPDTARIRALAKLELNEKTKARDQADDERNYGGYNYHNDRPARSSYQKTKGELFNFDPNTISAVEWKRLGIRDKTIGTIQNYLRKGGQFRKAEDLRKVYGLFPDEYERLEPYIQIGNGHPDSYRETIDNKRTSIEDFPEIKNNLARTADYNIPDINSADTNALIALPGIGSKLASRIINFRDKLGGFYSIEQVGETFGLADSTFQKIKQYLKLGSGVIKKINLNTASLDELKAHPYIKYVLANPITAYRNQHGAFKKIEELKNIMAITEDSYEKIRPYLFIE